MNKKLILLILVLPLILMISLFTTVNTVSLTVAVPVSKIEILGSKMVYLDLDKEEKYFIDYAVYPTTASNQKVEFSTEPNGNARLAELEYKDGYICPKSVGQAKVYLTTADGGFKDSLIVQVDANSLQAIECSVEKSALIVGETTRIHTEFVPRNAPNQQLKYEVAEGADVVSVNSQGVVTAHSVGTAKIKVSSRINEDICDEVTISVSSSAVIQFIEKSITNTLEQTGGAIPLYIESGAESVDYEIEILNESGNATESIISCVMDMENKRLGYTFLDQTFVGSVTVKLTVRKEGLEPYTDSCTIARIREIEVAWNSEESVTVITVGATELFYFTVTPKDVELAYTLTLKNDNGYISVTEHIAEGYLEVTAIKAGEDAKNSYTDIELTVWNQDTPNIKKTLTMRVCIFSNDFSS